MNRILFLALLTSLVSVQSCKKEKDDPPANEVEITSASDNSTAENLFADVFKVVDESAKQTSELNKTGSMLDTCATITVQILDTVAGWPIRITIDFGTGCTSLIDGRTRKGVIVAEFTGRYRDPGTVITITPQNYYVNNYKVEGSKTITNDGYNVDSNLTFTVVVTGGKITSPTGDVFTWQSNRTNEWIEGDDTPWPNICDDVYLITGTASGVNRKGTAFTVTITTELRKEICCRHIVSGVLEIVPAGLAARVIDYGTGACDGNITVTVNGRTFNVVLP